MRYLYMSENNHIIDWARLDMICKENSIKRWKIVESAVINSVSTMNLSDGCYTR